MSLLIAAALFALAVVIMARASLDSIEALREAANARRDLKKPKTDSTH